MQLFKLFLEFAFSASNNRRKDHNAFAVRQFGNAIRYLIDRLSGDRGSAFVTMRLADRREEQAEKIIDLRNGSDGGPWASRDGLLLD